MSLPQRYQEGEGSGRQKDNGQQLWMATRGGASRWEAKGQRKGDVNVGKKVVPSRGDKSIPPVAEGYQIAGRERPGKGDTETSKLVFKLQKHLGGLSVGWCTTLVQTEVSVSNYWMNCHEILTIILHSSRATMRIAFVALSPKPQHLLAGSTFVFPSKWIVMTSNFSWGQNFNLCDSLFFDLFFVYWTHLLMLAC